MVELVLRDPRGKALELELDRVALLVTRLEPDAQRALHRDDDALHRETTLVVLVDLVRALDDRRVDERARVLVLVRLNHEDAPEDADLIRGEPNPARVLHQVRHPLDELLQILVERVHFLRLEPQDGVRVLTDLGERETAPGFYLRVELVGLDLAFLGHRFEFSQTLCGSTSTTAESCAARIALEAEPSR